MLLFLSTYTNNVDKKGRITVPSSFRTELDQNKSEGVIAFPHPELDCIEVWDRERMARYAEGMDDLSPMSAEYAAVSTLMSKGRMLSFDTEGRVILPEDMTEKVKIEGEVVFAGRGQTFQIWEPSAFEAYESEASTRVLASKDSIRLAPPRNRRGDGCLC